MPALLYSILLIVVALGPGTVSAQCVGEVCLQEKSEELPIAVTEEATEATTETYSDEEAELVAGITRDLKRRSLTRPTGNNAYEKILKLRDIHPQHDYAVNGEKYIARILMLLGRQAVRRGDLDLSLIHI